MRGDIMTVNILEKPDKIIGGIRYFNTDSVCKILSLSRITVSGYFKKGILPSAKIGKRWYINQDDLEYFIVNGKLKKIENLTFKDYKILESDFLNSSEDNLRKVDKILKDLRRKYPISWLKNVEVYQNFKKRYEDLKELIKECKNEKMTKNDYDNFIER